MQRYITPESDLFLLIIAFTDNIPEFFENTHFLKFGINTLWFVL